MRIATSMIFDAGVRSMNSQTGKLLAIQQQVATGRRIVTPADDPVAAARALELTQAKDVVAQFSRNRDSAQNTLALQETQLIGVGDMLIRVRELTVQAGDGALSNSDRLKISTELRSRFDELMGLANSTDGSGKFIFSGFMGDTRPFTGSPESPVDYHGDDGSRTLQVTPSRVIEVSDSGRNVFERIRDGNGYFTTDVNVAPPATFAGTGVIDGGAVLDPAVWTAGWANAEAAGVTQLDIRFWEDSNHQLTNPGKTYYDIVDPITGDSLISGGPSINDPTDPSFSFGQQYKAGQQIPLVGPGNVSLGGNVSITGEPKTGDSFSIRPSRTQTVFETMQNLIADIERPDGTASDKALLANRIGFALTNISQVQENILTVRASIGSRMSEIESLAAVNEDLQIQYDQAISQLQDLDYAKALSDLQRKQIDLEAAQKSYSQISKLSLFNYL